MDTRETWVRNTAGERDRGYIADNFDVIRTTPADVWCDSAYRSFNYISNCDVHGASKRGVSVRSSATRTRSAVTGFGTVDRRIPASGSHHRGNHPPTRPAPSPARPRYCSVLHRRSVSGVQQQQLRAVELAMESVWVL